MLACDPIGIGPRRTDLQDTVTVSVGAMRADITTFTTNDPTIVAAALHYWIMDYDHQGTTRRAGYFGFDGSRMPMGSLVGSMRIVWNRSLSPDPRQRSGSMRQEWPGSAPHHSHFTAFVVR